MHTIRLIYASTADAGLGYGDLVSLLRTASARNAAHDLTGMLVFGNGFFLQALEGERAAVNRLYGRIVADARHRDCQLLSVQEIDSRVFVDWSMKLCGLDDLPSARRRRVLLRHAGTQRFEPHELTAHQAEAFLRDLARHERRADRRAAA